MKTVRAIHCTTAFLPNSDIQTTFIRVDLEDNTAKYIHFSYPLTNEMLAEGLIKLAEAITNDH